MQVFIFGNPDVPADSLPPKLLPQLHDTFPHIRFEMKDPNEEWDVPEELVVIDTAEGIERVTVFTDLTVFAASPRLTMHDFDALSNLRYLQKLGKLKKISIIGVPPMMDETRALEDVTAALRGIIAGGHQDSSRAFKPS